MTSRTSYHPHLWALGRLHHSSKIARNCSLTLEIQEQHPNPVQGLFTFVFTLQAVCQHGAKIPGVRVTYF